MSAEAAESVGAGIRRLRTARGLTQRDLAQPEYSRALLAAVEAGIRSPTDDLLRHVARRLDVELEDLRHGRPPGLADELAAALADARRALARGETDAAAAVFARARAEATRFALPDLACWAGYLAGEARLQHGDLPAALAAFDDLADVLGAAGPAARAAVVARRAYCQFAAGDAAGAVAAIEAALTEARRTPDADPDALLRLSSGLMYAYLELDWRDRARQIEAQSRDLLPLGLLPHGLPGGSLPGGSLLSGVVAPGTDRDGEGLAGPGGRAGNLEWVAQFLTVAAQLRRGEDELAEAEPMLTAAAALYEELGLTREVGLCRWALGYVLRRSGRLDEAAAAFDAACTVLSAVGAAQDLAGAALELAEVRRRQGDLTDAARLAREAAETCERSQHLECMAEADRLLGLVAAARAEPDAERLLQRAADRYTRIGLMSEVMATCRALGELQLAQGDPTAAAASFRRGLQAAVVLR